MSVGKEKSIPLGRDERLGAGDRAPPKLEGSRRDGEEPNPLGVKRD